MPQNIIKYIEPLLSCVIGVGLFLMSNYWLQEFNPNEVGLGKNTTSHVARINGITLSGITDKIDSVILFIKKIDTIPKKTRVGIWIGNSQLHAINEYEKGDNLAIYYAQKELLKEHSDIFLFQFSSPHLSMVEELIYINTLRKSRITPDFLILPITFRSFHFIQIRNELKKGIGYNGIADDIENATIKDYFLGEVINDNRGKLTASKETWQDVSESYFISIFNKHIPFFKFKDNTKTYIKFLPLFIVHSILGTSNDPQVAGNSDIIEMNILALKEIINYAKENDIKILMYQVPHPQDDNYFFYDKGAYNKFFTELNEITMPNENVKLLNLEKMVPVSFWGINNDGYKDTYHFQSLGHQILGDTIASSLISY